MIIYIWHYFALYPTNLKILREVTP